ncbi:unnamed protein product [Closterium sp. NIES-54]
MTAAKRVLRYLCSTSGLGLVLGGRSPVVLTGHADASWVDDLATQRSSQGYTFSLGSGSVSWRSTRSSSVLSFSCEAEIYAGAMAPQERRWLTYLLTNLGEPPRSPPVLYVDNKALLALCREHRLEHRMKQIALRYFLARELQQHGQLRLAYVASQANTADIFTKALQPGDHQRFCTMLASAEDDDGVESWWHDARREKMPIPTHKPSQHKRQAYTSQEKLRWLVRLELAASVSEVARESGIHRNCLTEWKSQAEELKASHAARCRLHGRGRSSWYRPMELKVYAQLLDWRRRGVAVSVGRLQEWSRKLMKVLFVEVKWKGSQRWSERFRKRWNLSCKEFWQFVRDARNEYAIDNRYIINADETPLWLEMPATTTVEQTGVKSVPICSAGYQKERVTVMLACTATGEKLKPWVFFKRKTLPKGDFSNANGRMEATGVIQWLDEGVVPFPKPKFGVQSRSAMLVLDSYHGHLTKEVKARFTALNLVPAVILAGSTPDVQPIDVSVNKSFKARKIKKPPPEVVLKWISRAWKAVPADLIKKSFLTCGITNALDGSEDHMVMAHRRSQLSHEVEVDDDIQADGFRGNNSTNPESDVEEVEA